VGVDIVAWVVAAAVFSRMLIRAAAHLRAAATIAEEGSSDVTVTILSTVLAPCAHGDSSVVISIFNPGRRPVLAGLSVRRRRRSPDWLGAAPCTRIARLTAGRRYRADRHRAIVVVAAGGITVLPVGFAATRRRYCIVAVLGQADNRLRVIRLPFDTRSKYVGGPAPLRSARGPQ
jgi:hypothetical protein